MQPDCLKDRVVCGTVYGDYMYTLKRYCGMNRKNMILYPGPGFLSIIKCCMAFDAKKNQLKIPILSSIGQKEEHE